MPPLHIKNTRESLRIFFTPFAHNKYDMTILTALMLLALLCLMPLKISVLFRVDFSQKCLFLRVKLFFVKVVDEKISLKNFRLVCRGTIDADIDILQMDGKRGASFVKALTFDSVLICFAPNYGIISPFAMPLVEGTSFCCATLSRICSHCRVRICSGFSFAHCCSGKVTLSVALAEILEFFVKDKLRTRKPNYW